MTKHYEQRKKSNEDYLKKLDEIKVRVPKGMKSEYKKIADSKGKSLNQFIIDAIEQYKDASTDNEERTIMCTVVDNI